MEKAKEYEWIEPRMAELRSRYPEPAMIDGLQPALTSDVMEIVAEARKEERGAIDLNLLRRILLHVAPSNVCDLIYRSPSAQLRHAADEIEQKERDAEALRSLIKKLSE